MRLERLTYNKIKIFLTTDDLSERGLTKEDIWKDSLKWHQLFYEMLEEASEEYGVDIQGSVAVEIFSMHTQGMIMIVTMEEHDEDEFLRDGFVDLQVNSHVNDELLFEFTDIEDLIHLSLRLADMDFQVSSLYNMNDKYFLLIKCPNAEDKDRIAANMAEFGCASLESVHRLKEYGKLVIENKAIETLVHYFH